jgi:restriction system protein
MRRYYRVTLGQGNSLAQECFAENYIGVGFGINQDLTHKLPEEWRDFNKEFAPIYLRLNPGKSRIAAGLACGALWTVSKGIQVGDIVLSPDGEGHFHVGEVTGNYYHKPGTPLQHRRPIKWLNKTLERAALPDAVRKAIGVQATYRDITSQADILERLLDGASAPEIVTTDPTIEDPSEFALEKHLEEFLVQNWERTALSKDYDIYELDGEIVGQQFKADTGRIDILGISKDKKTLLVIELKKSRASDVVVGQTLRYMGFVKDEMAESGQNVKGVIIALEDDQRIRRALSAAPNIEFYRYQVSFKLVKG